MAFLLSCSYPFDFIALWPFYGLSAMLALVAKFVLWSGDTVKSCDSVLVNFSLNYCNLLRQKKIICMVPFQNLPKTAPSLFRYFQGSGWGIRQLEDRKYQDRPMQLPGISAELSCNLIFIFPFDCRVKARSAEFAIHLFAEDVLQSIHLLFDYRVRHKVPKCVILAILPFVTLLIAGMRHEVLN